MMEEKVLEILKELRPDVDFTNQNGLIDDAILDSFDVINLIGELCNAFDIEIGVEDIIPENFNSILLITAMIKRLEE